MIRPPPNSTLFPYTPLSRSRNPASPAERELGLRRLASGATRSDGGLVVIRAGARQDVRSRHEFRPDVVDHADRSEEHTSELQSLAYLVCRLLLEKKKNN